MTISSGTKRCMQIVVELRTDKTPEQLERAMKAMLREKRADVIGVGVIEFGNDFISLRERWVRPDMPIVQEAVQEGVPDARPSYRANVASDGWVEPDPRIPEGTARGAKPPIGHDAEHVGDDLIMPFGKYRGKRIGDVPAQYLLWYHGQPWAPNFPYVFAYCCRNWSLLDEEAGEAESRDAHGAYDAEAERSSYYGNEDEERARYGS